ncbi:MAG: MAPEG family protein [Sphingomonadales bacterium]|nr:MAPEG family protein [Sphingomonadales bacterium]
MITIAMLKPVVALAGWTMIMWFWLYATRLPAMGKVDMSALANDPTKTLDHVLPANVQWKAHNYNHLHEAPTVFYAVCLVIALTGNGGGYGAKVAWAYVGLRIVHSLVQVTINNVPARFVVFVLSSLCLMALVWRAAQVTFGL